MTGTAGARARHGGRRRPRRGGLGGGRGAGPRPARRRGRVLLICHVNPDGDALGSMLGFGLGLRRLGVRRLQATFPGPPEVPEPFRWLPGLELLVPGERRRTRHRTW